MSRIFKAFKMELKGRIIKVLPLQSGEGKNGQWKRQDYILEYGEQYPKQVCFGLRGSRIDQYQLNIDEEVTVSFDLESREFNGRYYTDVKAWKIDRAGAAAPQPAAPQGGYSQPAAPQTSFGQPAAGPAPADDKDDLPF